MFRTCLIGVAVAALLTGLSPAGAIAPDPPVVTVNASAPVIDLTGTPHIARAGEVVTVQLQVSDPEGHITHLGCRGSWSARFEPCVSPWQVTPVADWGYRTIEVEAVNSMGRRSTASMTIYWDRERPQVRIDRQPLLLLGAGSFQVEASDFTTRAVGGQLALRARYRVISPRARAGRWVHPPAWNWSMGWRAPHARPVQLRPPPFQLGDTPKPGRSVCVQAGATDLVGQQRWNPPICMVRPWDDRQLRRRGAWREVRRKDAYRGTTLRTTQRGARLTLTRPSPSREALLLVRTCPECGDIAFTGPSFPQRGYPMQTHFSLRSARPGWKKIPLRFGGLRHRGGYHVTVTSTGRPVEIDGIAVSPWRLPAGSRWQTRRENPLQLD